MALPKSKIVAIFSRLKNLPKMLVVLLLPILILRSLTLLWMLLLSEESNFSTAIIMDRAGYVTKMTWNYYHLGY